MTTPTSEIVQLQVGDTKPVGTVLANLIIMAMVTDVNNPNMFMATLQAHQSQAVMTVPALQGIKGDPGQPTFALRFQNDSLSSPASLPTTLGNTSSDLGKYWVFGVTDQNSNVIATDMWVWYGTTLGWKTFPVGSPGPPGPFPLITPTIVLEVPGNGNGPNGVDSWVAVTGTVSNPTFEFHVASPQGVAGPSGTLSTCPDLDFVTSPPVPGNTLVCSSRTVPGAPSGLSITPHPTGGTLGANTWFYVVTSLVPNGETMQSNEVEATTTGTTSSITLNWTAPGAGGATGYNVYRGNSALNITVLVATISGGGTTTYTDTGGAGTPASPPSAGVVAGRSIWVPQTPLTYTPKLYTVPSSGFSSVAAVGGSSVTVSTFAIPPQPWPWKPFVFGQMKSLGNTISFTPMQVDAQVLLGDPKTGTPVGLGKGNSQGSIIVIPQGSSDTNPSAAITPNNNHGYVPANHTGNQGTLFTNIQNSGMAGNFNFQSVGSQLSVLVVPVVPQ
jgi:hypothetical protein